jgi:ubiquitin thioesterase OTU1
MYTDPVTFSDVFLERPNEDYAKWILLPKSWGGAIELAILSDHYSTEIAAFDVSTTRMDCYGMWFPPLFLLLALVLTRDVKHLC